MADAAVSFLLDNVTQLLLREAGMIQGVAPEIKLLKVELALIHEFLRDSEGKRDQIKEVIDNIQSIAHEAEDVIDTFLVDVAKHRRRNMIGRVFHIFHHTLMLRGVASKIKTIKDEVAAIYSCREKYGIFTSDASGNESIARMESLRLCRRRVEEDDVVSFLKDAKIVMDMLNSYNSDLDIVSIVGEGGLGKTTLAKKIYNDTNVKSRFSCRAWAKVSEDFHPRDVFLQILESIPKSAEEMLRIPEMNEENLGKKLRSLLEKKKYLIVLDDVWKPEAWTRMKGAFPETKNGSRILITSRKKEVASYVSTTLPYFLPLLNKDDSWELFSKKAFRGAACPPTFESTGRKIVEKCRGLPLALVVVGGLLATRDQSTLVWSKMVDNVSWYLEKNPESSNDVLALSYKDLPAHLKPCFLYLGVYPEDYEMSGRQLIRLWIAEGLVEQDTRFNPEDIADEYLQDLANRSLIMIEKQRSDGGIKTCRIHDLLRDLCIAEGAQDNFFVVHDGKGFIKSCNNRPRRISLLCNTSGYSSSSVHLDSSLLRSLLCFSDNEQKFPPFVFKDSRLTRVLDFGQNTPKYYLSPKFGKLVLSRYLRIDCSYLDYSLPRFLCNLPNLQTLDLRGSSIGPSRHFWNMQQLRHLLIDYFSFVSDDLLYMKTMPNLQTLAYANSLILHEGVCEIAFPNLRKLKVKAHPSSYLTIPASSIPSYGNVQTLKIVRYTLRSRNLLTHGGALSSRLTKLTLLFTKLRDADFSSLLFPNLEILKLMKNSLNHESTGQLTNKSLCKLEVLVMVELKVDRWWVDEECLSNLKFLKIRGCSNLPMAPERLKDATTLRHVKVSGCNLTLENSFRALGLSENTSFEFEDNYHEVDAIE